jgi:hypothetical protein
MLRCGFPIYLPRSCTYNNHSTRYLNASCPTCILDHSAPVLAFRTFQPKTIAHNIPPGEQRATPILSLMNTNARRRAPADIPTTVVDWKKSSDPTRSLRLSSFPRKPSPQSAVKRPVRDLDRVYQSNIYNIRLFQTRPVLVTLE